MPFDLPSPAEFREYVAALGQALYPDQNFGSRLSYHGKEATFVSNAVSQIHAHADSAQRDVHPLTAGEGKPITDWTSAVGVRRKLATGSRKAKAGRIRGAAGATVLPDTELQHATTGLIFRVANIVTVTIPGVAGVDPDSYFDADIAAVSTGEQTRLTGGEVLNFLTPPPGIESQVVLQFDLDEDGFDTEEYGSLRGRFLRTLSSTPAGGNPGDFVGWIEESLETIRRGFCYRNRNGRGSVDILGFYAGNGASRVLSSDDREAMLDYVRSKVPIQLAGDDGDLRAIVTVPDPQTVRILITPDGIISYRFDWGGGGEVLSWNGTTRELQFAGGSLPQDLRAAARVILEGTVAGSGAQAQDGRQYKVESISAVDKVILDEVPPTAPAAGDLIWPGGPLVDPIRNAVVAHLNGEDVYSGPGQIPLPRSATEPDVLKGLTILALGIGPSNPGGRYGSWVGGINRGNLQKIAGFKAGVRDVNVLTPAANYEPLDDRFPSNGQIHFVTPAVVIVREGI